MGDVKLFRLSGSAAVIDLRTGNNATLRPGLVVLSEDAHTHAIATLEAENAKLRAGLERRAVDGWKLVPEKMLIDAASIEALAFVMGGPEEDDGSPTYCDCVMWVGEIDDDGVKRHGIQVYNTECEEEGSTTLAEFAAAPAPVAGPASQWVAVSERLPEPETDVLVLGYKHNSLYHTVAGLFHGEWYSQETEDPVRFEVVEWSPLPPAPELGK